MNELLLEYLPILVFFVIAIIMSAIFVLLPILVVKQKPDAEKLSAYECGFEAFSDNRKQFDVRFYLVAILFIIFDLEVAFLFPWAVALGSIGMFGFVSMMIFLGVLTIGFIYEWKKGALEWE
ncbi:NADH-quinone oxidoreductase subunit A [Pseudemcibacter aquimaris]|uniref:NADH-quinone oxidoreductase subunit A n=1 Tax=Pseudemcibacter aquimaris TaxID=2857064 RepID=UPI002013013B|nr:NADH-quinone oxidoreductase subunit A [Pseudemcibacter aquimaris]MCC3860855.1 NADH-quinone oxidoreductase subunit A [Pseudemcibacter aquimaris]WDU59674.1 NADH-quinone oxidoreductase subunit A [Pseudemcibacter aquimaris]